MKNTLRTLIAAVLLLVALTPVRALAAATVYAAESASDSVAAATAPAPDANPATATANETSIPLSGNANVRIDDTGVHIGGVHPVDITVPTRTRDHERKKTGMEAVPSIIGSLVPIVGTLAVFGMPVAITAVILLAVHRKNKMTHEVLRAMIEKGMPITPELVHSLKEKDHPDRPRRGLLLPGLILAGIGTALIISDSDTFKGGLIVLFIGVAFLVVWLMERKNQNGGQPPR